MPRTLRLIAFFFAAIAAHAATLQQLSLDQMSQFATAVVRAHVIGSSATVSTTTGSPTIYTHYKLDVSEVWKGSAAAEVMLPGGDVNGMKQTFPGVPALRVGAEYVLFLWKSPSTGIMHTVGLTQGIFETTARSDGSIMVGRRRSGELMLDASGHRVTDQAISMKLEDLKTRVRDTPRTLSATGSSK